MVAFSVYRDLQKLPCTTCYKKFNVTITERAAKADVNTDGFVIQQ
jgi:hypothetical protein